MVFVLSPLSRKADQTTEVLYWAVLDSTCDSACELRVATFTKSKPFVVHFDKLKKVLWSNSIVVVVSESIPERTNEPDHVDSNAVVSTEKMTPRL